MALAIATTWESPKDAKEFAAAYARSLEKDRGELVYGKKHLGGGPKASSDTAGLPPAFVLYAGFP